MVYLNRMTALNGPETLEPGANHWCWHSSKHPMAETVFAWSLAFCPCLGASTISITFAGCADALEELARDLSSSNTADKERAVSMLSSLTPYLEYHSAMLEAGVFPALIKAVLDARMIPQVSPTKAGVTMHCLQTLRSSLA